MRPFFSRRSRRATTHRRPTSYRPCLEALEDRCLLSAGDLDLTFGVGGKVTTDFAGSEDRANTVAIQANGQIVVVGGSNSLFFPDFALARYNPDGRLDTSFGAGGKVTTDFAGFADGASAVALQADGKIVVGGFSQQGGTCFECVDFALARYNSDGSLDDGGPSDSTPGDRFGTGGKVTTDFGNTHDAAQGLVIQADGKIVLVGLAVQSTPFGNVGDFALARYNPDGSLDDGSATDSTPGDSFGTSGKVTTDFGNTDDAASALAIQADGKVVAAGYSNQSGTLVDFALARYNSDGTLDASFDGDGKVTTHFGSSDAATGLAIQADGRIVAVGETVWDFAVARYNPNGSLDTSFDGDGKATTDFGSSQDFDPAVALQADGKIILAGTSNQSGTGNNFALARYNPNGSLDTRFGAGGKLTTDFATPDDRASDVAIQADGKIIVVGTSNFLSNSGPFSDFALARYAAVSPQGQIEPIIDKVQALVAGGVLNHGQGKALLVKLQAAIQQLDSGNITAAKQLLQAFVDHVGAFITAGILMPAQGQPLIDDANAIIAQLGGHP